jgi:hypothetical protein
MTLKWIVCSYMQKGMKRFHINYWKAPGESFALEVALAEFNRR